MSRRSKSRRPLRTRVVRLGVALAAACGLVVSGMVGVPAAQAAPDVVYNAFVPTLPGNVISQGFEVTQTDELGDLVALAPGPRELTTVSVVLSSWACETGTAGPTCVTTPGATFNHPLTMTLYNVAGTPAAPTVGSVIATVTQTFAIPFRPSADLVNCPAGGWFDGTSCFSGFATVVDFVFPPGTMLPDTLIWGIAYNTNNSGYTPIGAAGPYDSLNVGSETFDPTVGTDVNEDMAFIATGTGTFASELGWTGFRPMARIEVAPVQPPADGWVPLGGIVVDSPAATTPAPGRLDVVVRGVDDQLWHKWFDAGSWSGWEALGGLTTAGPATTWSGDRFDVFVNGIDGQLWHKWWDGAWSDWVPLGGIVVDSPAAASWGAGRLDVVVRGIDDQLWHKWFDGGSWSGWEPLGGLTTAGPATTSWSAGRLDVFVNGIDGQLWHKWWDGAWSDWVPLGGIVLDSPAATTPGSGRLDVVVRGIDDQPWHKWFDAGSWSGWEALGGLTTAGPAAASWSAGRLDVFVNGIDGQLWHRS